LHIVLPRVKWTSRRPADPLLIAHSSACDTSCHYPEAQTKELQATGWYAIGADWAKEKDKTVIVVARVDEKPWRIVYLRAVNRKPYPEIAAMFNDALMKYQAVAAHDGTGFGNVINDLIDERAHKVLMVGRGRTELLVDYINAVEKGVYRLPANTPAFAAHKGTTVDEVYAPGPCRVVGALIWPGHPRPTFDECLARIQEHAKIL